VKKDLGHIVFLLDQESLDIKKTHLVQMRPKKAHTLKSKHVESSSDDNSLKTHS